MRRQSTDRLIRSRLPAQIRIQQPRQCRHAQHHPHQNRRLSHIQLIHHQLINLHLNCRITAAAEQQRQSETRKTIQKYQTSPARQPRAQHRPFHKTKPLPSPRTQRLRRLQPRLRHLQKTLIRRAHQHRQVEKHIAVKQQIRRILPARPQHTVCPEQSQHTHPDHQSRHHKRQH